MVRCRTKFNLEFKTPLKQSTLFINFGIDFPNFFHLKLLASSNGLLLVVVINSDDNKPITTYERLNLYVINAIINEWVQVTKPSLAFSGRLGDESPRLTKLKGF